MMDDMPDFKPSNMDERVKRALAAKGRTHFSREDWDFWTVNWTLDAAIYKAASPSLHSTSTTAALVKNATTGALSDGRLIAWLRSHDAALMTYFWFRNQVADGSYAHTNTYYVVVGDDYLQLAEYVGGGYNLIDTHAFTWTWSVDTWYKLRVTWWTSVARLYVRFERWTGAEWVTLGGDADTDFEDANDRWKDAAVNRCGFYLPGDDVWVDDVEVWG